MGAPVVLHAVRTYLPLTENWIYSQMRHAAGFEPVAVCTTLQNREAFPLPHVHALAGGALAWLNSAWRRAFYWNWPGAYRAMVAAHRPRLIHAHFGDQGVLILGTARKHRIPLVTTFYGYDVSTLPREAKWVPRLKRLFEQGDLFLAEGPHMRDRLVALGCPAAKVRVQHLGVDVAGIPFAERTAPADGVVRVLMAASFREKKGMAYGIEAFARARAARPGRLALTIIGDGPLRAELEALAARLGVADEIRWLGYQPHAAFVREAAAAHVFMSPSVTAADGDTEGGAPVAITEAQAAGLPVLATTHADIPEVTRPGESAFLVPERDVDALAERLGWLADHPEAWGPMGRAGRAHVEAEFDAVVQGERLAAIYRELLERRSGRSAPTRAAGPVGGPQARSPHRLPLLEQ